MTLCHQPVWSKPSRSVIVRFVLLTVCGLFGAVVSADEEQPEIYGRVHAGGTARYMSGRWCLVKGFVSNSADVPQQIQLVVTPPGSNGVQYARKLTVPGGSSLETVWPMFVPKMEGGNINFRYLVFPGGEDDGVIRTKRFENKVTSFNAIVEGEQIGYTGWLAPENVTDEHRNPVLKFLRALRFSAYREQRVVTLIPRELSNHSEGLDSLDQLAVSGNDLENYPEVCEAIRLWLQRGGKLIVFLDRSGTSATDLLLGDALPLTVVGETSDNKITLDLNPEYRQDQYPIRQVVREFDEPIRYLRTEVAGAEPIWLVDGWPVAMRVSYGRGTVLLTTISPEVFYKERAAGSPQDMGEELISSMRRFQDSLFTLNRDKLLDANTVTQQAATQIGYSIPSRAYAAAVTVGFPLILLILGSWLLKQQRGERLIWAVPCLATIAALPAAYEGIQMRSIAPPTAIQHQIVNSIPGQSQLVSDGFATVYVPSPGALQVAASEGTTMEPPIDETNADIRRQLWTGKSENHWVNLNLPSGISSMAVRSNRRLSSPLAAHATFDENGLTGTLTVADLQNPSDVIFAGLTPDRMAINVGSNLQITGTPSDILAENEFFRDTLLAEEQSQRAAVLRSLFSRAGAVDAFPESPSILYWADGQTSSLNIGTEETTKQESLLVVQPLQLHAPEAGKPITIPATLVPYKVVADAEGSVSAAFNNTKREWSPREEGGNILLEFSIPRECTPFDPSSLAGSLRIQAGSRRVRIVAGPRDKLQLVTELNSPVGVFNFIIPPELVRESCLAGKVYVQLEVGAFNQTADSKPMSGEQDDAWKVDRILLTFNGQRTP